MTRKKSAPALPSANKVMVRLLQRTDWPVILRLFGERGACGGCWCMWWRVPQGGKLWQDSKRDVNRANSQRLAGSSPLTNWAKHRALESSCWSEMARTGSTFSQG